MAWNFEKMSVEALKRFERATECTLEICEIDGDFKRWKKLRANLEDVREELRKREKKD